MKGKLVQRLRKLERRARNDPAHHAILYSYIRTPDGVEHWLEPAGPPPTTGHGVILIMPCNNRDLRPEHRPRTMSEAEWLAHAHAHGARWAGG